MSDRETAAWPNITLVGGRLYGLGIPVSLPEGFPAIDASGRRRPADGCQARPVIPCVATGEGDRSWLASQTPKGYRPALVGNYLAMLPEAVLAIPWGVGGSPNNAARP